MDNTKNFNLKKPSAEDWYNIQDHNDNMDIVDAELKKLNDGKAPSGHGLGETCPGENPMTFFETMQKGCGFYRVGQATDAPEGITDWFGNLQIIRSRNANSETGTQLAFHDFNKSKPRMWFRTIALGEPSVWNEILHTGNIGKYADAKFACGTYTGVLKEGVGGGSVTDPYLKSKTLPLPFKADYLVVIGATQTLDDGQPYPLTNYMLTIAKGVPYAIAKNPNWDLVQNLNYKWSGNTVTWGTKSATEESVHSCMNYSGCTYAWFAWGKGEGV
jgi:hypothetical protein